MTRKKNVVTAGPVVLVGTYRLSNRKWICEKKLYNLPYIVGADINLYKKICQIVLIAHEEDHIAFSVEFECVRDAEWLRANGYKVSSAPHAEQYVIYRLNDSEDADEVLSNESAEVYVCSTRFTGRIDKEFFNRPLPDCGGKSVPNIFEKLRPYANKWQNAYAVNPEQMDFLCALGTPSRYGVPFPAPKDPKFTFIDLFAGIGGFRLAMQKNGGECVFSSEWNESAQRTYFANYGDMPSGDITSEATKRSIPKDFDILCAGFPCQPFSIAGVSKKNSLGRATGFEDETQGTLFFDVCTILKRRRPKAFLLENVKNLCSHDKGNTYRVIRSALDELDYEVFDQVIDGQNFVPQHRERILLVGFDRKRYGKGISFEFAIEPITPRPKVRDILEYRPDPKYTLTDKLWSYLQRYAEKHRAAGNGFGFGLAPLDGVSRTLSARYYKDGSEILIEQGKGANPRRLTPRECARLMGYPDTFNIVVSDCQAYKQFGNSVVMPLMADVGRLITEKLEQLDNSRGIR